MAEWLTYPITVALLVPMLLLVAGGLGKKLIRGKGWEVQDFYLGVEAALAALTSGITFMFEVAKTYSSQSDLTNDGVRELLRSVGRGAAFIAVCFFLFLYLLAMHQNVPKPASSPGTSGSPKPDKWEVFWLLIVSNLIGCGLMAMYVFSVKGLDK